jgi:hypothetical protein
LLCVKTKSGAHKKKIIKLLNSIVETFFAGMHTLGLSLWVTPKAAAEHKTLVQQPGFWLSIPWPTNVLAQGPSLQHYAIIYK